MATSSPRQTRLFPAGGIGVVLGIAAVSTGMQEPILLLLLPVLVRAVLISSVAVHEAAHALVAGRLDRDWRRTCLQTLPARGFLPFQALYIPGLSDSEQAPRVAIDGVAAGRRRWAALAGPAANLALVLASLLILFPIPELTPQLVPDLTSAITTNNVAISILLPALICLINLWILLTCWTDYAALLGACGDTLYCGNFGILAKRHPTERGFLPRRFRALAERLGEETDIRGQQAGGIAVMSAGGRFVGRKIVNDKRGNLTHDLLNSFGHRALLGRFVGAKPMRGLFHLVGHSRYGTSSGPSVLETHWHRWCRPRRIGVWSVEGHGLICRRRVVENLITHNGDFDAWNAPWGRIDRDRLGHWLATVLGGATRRAAIHPRLPACSICSTPRVGGGLDSTRLCDTDRRAAA